ncbi:MAG: hypothetical protein K0R46_2513 [Herbinix sp.]|jgi:hypothetical protein|nr:hypothetical protein [Herbinix sp.]
MSTFLVVLILFGAVLEWLSLRDNITDLSYHCVPSKLGCEPEEVFWLQTTLTNYSVRTISYLKMEELFPKEIHILGVADQTMADHRCRLQVSMLSIRGRQKITRTLQASLPNRGVYAVEGCSLLRGDFLGIKEKCKLVEQREEIIIFPRLLQEASILQALSGYYGDFSSRRFYIEDPILVSSYMDYTGREPLRSISWTQSARRNQIMVKEFDHTMDMSVTILLDVYQHWSEGAHREELEYCFSLARTIAEEMEKKKVSYRLLTNAYIRSDSSAYEGLRKAGQGAHHYTTLLYTLGQADANSFRDIDELYQMAIVNYSGEKAIFYVAPFVTDKRENLAIALQKRLGCQVYPMYAPSGQEGKQDAI